MPRPFGYKCSDETRKKTSLSMKGKPSWRKGRPLSLEHKRKIGDAQIGNKNHAWKGGKPKCLDCDKILFHRDNIFKRCRTCAIKSGYLPANKNKSLKHSGSFKPGRKHWNWKGGRCRNKHSITSPAYKKWRKAVFERDNYTCQDCDLHNGDGKTVYLEAHHIKSWAKFPKLRYRVSNGITLCERCHGKISPYFGNPKIVLDKIIQMCYILSMIKMRDIHIRITVEKYGLIKKLADTEDRKVTAIITRALDNYLKSKKVLKE